MMINFTVGPVMSCPEVRKIGAENVPYFRTPEFSEIMLENEALIKEFSGAKEDARVVFVTGSGTASMEASVMNFFGKNDKLLVINGGSFGQRFADLCALHELDFTEIKIEIGNNVTYEMLDEFSGKGYTGLLVNLDETSVGTLYDIEVIGEFCKKNNIFLLVDSISSFLADSFNMEKYSVGAMIAGSQKALACPPGISVIVLSKEAIDRVEQNTCKCMYLDIKDMLKNMERGQTPFTPAVGILLQINERLKQIKQNGGVESEVKRIADLAEYFRDGIKDLPLKLVTKTPSNAVTALYPQKENAYEIFSIIKDEYKMWVCPNGGKQKDLIFRVGHIGDLNKSHYDKLILALKELNQRGIL